MYGDFFWILLGGVVWGDIVLFIGEVIVCDFWGGGFIDRVLGGGCGFILFCFVGRVLVILGWCVGFDIELDGIVDSLLIEDELE